MCVGRRFPGIRWKVIRIVDGPIATLDEAEELPPHEIGELIVQGDVVTQAYVNRDDSNCNNANRWGKIAPGRDDAGGALWHRMGDVGYVDGPAGEPTSRFWFCGRLAHRVTTPQGPLFTIPCEAIFNRHPAVARTALVGIGPAGKQRPVLVVEPKPGFYPRSAAAWNEMVAQLRTLGAEHAITAGIDTFLPHRRFPVDIRHNAKIFREKLAVWAAKKLGQR